MSDHRGDLGQQDAQQGPGLFVSYDTPDFYCELMNRRDPASASLTLIRDRLAHFGLTELRQRARVAEADLYNLGITFTVYTDRDAIDRILPVDLIPRVLTAGEWDHVERGVQQRVAAINHFLWDIYHERRILKDGVVPAGLVLGNANYRPGMGGLEVPGRVYVCLLSTSDAHDRPPC